LNVELRPILSKYIDVVNESIEDKKSYSKKNYISNLDFNEPSKLTLSDIDLAFVYSPDILLEKLQDIIKIKVSQLESMAEANQSFGIYTKPLVDINLLNQLIYSEEPINSFEGEYNIPYFEILVKLYYKLKPHLLLPFVDVVSVSSFDQTQNRKYRKTFYQRAVNVLPPLMIGKEKVYEPSNDLFDKRLQARIILLDRSGESHRALRLFLSFGPVFWNRALEFVQWKHHHSHEVEHSELFHILLIHCLKNYNDPLIYDEIWKLMPEKFLSSDLMNILSSKFIQKKKDTEDIQNEILIQNQESKNLPLSILKQKLLEVFKNEQKNIV